MIHDDGSTDKCILKIYIANCNITATLKFD